MVVNKKMALDFDQGIVSFDSKKREQTLINRGLDFKDAPEVFNGPVQFTFEDERKSYGEERFITIGLLKGRVVVLVWTPRGKVRHIISLRKANEREKKKFKKFMD